MNVANIDSDCSNDRVTTLIMAQENQNADVVIYSTSDKRINLD